VVGEICRARGGEEGVSGGAAWADIAGDAHAGLWG